MKSIYVPLIEEETKVSQLETALIIARQYRSVIEGQAVRHLMATFSDDDYLLDMIEILRREENARLERVRAFFEKFMRQNRVPLGKAPPPPARWIEENPPIADSVGSRGRAYDLSVVRRPEGVRDVFDTKVLRSALFDSGRPAIIAPPDAPKQIGQNVLVAWNGSLETARTISFAMPFLFDAKSVTVLTVDGWGVHGPSGEELTAGLQRHGIAASHKVVHEQKRSSGATILRETASLGVDLLVKGAYTQSRIRQVIFGGATRHIIEHTPVPVFMAH